MAVIQISRIQHRRGQTKQTNFPQLASGEFGWSIDQQELFIGNGAVDEGAPAIGNTKIITEHDTNFFLLATDAYKYRSEQQPGLPSRYRTVQDKLDDIVSVNDFITDNTDDVLALQRAINHAAGIGRPLYVPEGTYSITATIFIPPNTELRGAGENKSILVNATTATMFQTQDLQGRRLGNLITGDPQGNADTPKDVHIQGLTFQSTLNNAVSILKLDCLLDSTIEHCRFEGAEASSTQATAIEFRGSSALTCDNISINNCVFFNLGNAIVSDYDIVNINITKNKFKYLDTGIVFAKTLTGAAPKQFGPRHIQILDNTFHTINKQAIFAGSTSTSFISDISSVNNYFYDIGNLARGDSPSTQVAEVIKFSSFGNYSEGDTFDRLTKINSSTQYISGSSSVKQLISGPSILKSKSPTIYNITGIGSGIPVFVYPRNTSTYSTSNPNQTITIDYTLLKPSRNITRRGKLEIMVNAGVATLRDDFTYTGTSDGNVTFTATSYTSKNLVAISLTNAYNDSDGNISYTFVARQ